ncbi:flavodoxin [Lacrimispora sp.]|uniref:flavodoxin n=1 Tax=Lacrimispora sp. TaxID=2719234 RepID=UPI00346167E7
MKKILAMMSFMLLVSLTACGNNSDDIKSDISKEADSAVTTNEQMSADNQSEDATEVMQSEVQENEGGPAKVLVAYYSASGNTERIANLVAEASEADTFVITPVEEYTDADLVWRDESSRVNQEHEDENRHVELISTEAGDFDSYEVIFIGYPIWWGDASWVVDDFVKNNDFTGKTVIPFATSSSSPLGESGTKLAAMAGTGEWMEGKRFSSGADESEVKEWVSSLDFFQ